MRRLWVLYVIFALASSLINAIPANASQVQVATHIDWNNFSLDANSGFAQSITPLIVPKSSSAYVDFSLNVGNNVNVLVPRVILNNNNGGSARFEMGDAGSDIQANGSGNTNCWVNNTNTFSDSKRKQASCTTPVPIVIGETYNFEVQPTNWGSSNSWTSYVTIKSTGQRINLGIISFLSPANIINQSASMSGFNQTSIYGENLNCQSAPPVSAIYGKPTGIRNGKQPNFSSTRNGMMGGNSIPCPNYSFTQNSDGSQTMKMNIGNPITDGSQITETPNQISSSKRIARLNSSWIRPSSLLPGLSEVRYKGYFNDNTAYFTDEAVKTKTSVTPANFLPDWRDDALFTGADMSMWWGGYFIPDETGAWEFQVTADDASFMWLGPLAISGYAQGYSNAFIALPGAHPPQSVSRSVYLEKNKIYPLRIQYGNAVGLGTFKFEIKPPSFKSTWDTNLEGLIWYSNYNDRDDCTNYGISYTLGALLGFGIEDVKGCKINPAIAYANGVPNNPSKIEVRDLDSSTQNNKNYGCPISANSMLPAEQLKVTSFTFTGTNQTFTRFKEGTTSATNSALPVIGCYGDLTGIARGTDLGWQYGIIDRDDSGYYWLNAAGIRWSLILNPDEKSFTTGKDNPYNSSGNLFILNGVSGRITNNSKINTPTFSAVNFSGNKINIKVNIGSTPSSKPNKIYLVAPKLGFSESNPAIGKIVGSIASWSLPFSAILSGTSIPLEIISERNGAKSSPLTGSYQIPEESETILAPSSPSKFSYRIMGSSVLVTVSVDNQNGSKATDAYLYSSDLGITKTQPLKGDVVGGKALFEIPLTNKMASKKYQVSIYSENVKGKSRSISETISIPGIPKTPARPTTIPSPKIDKTVICSKGNQVRTFIGTSCPPGWSKK